VATLAVTGRFDLSDAQWAVLERLLPKPKKPGRPPKWTKRWLIDGIRWRVRDGSPWRDAPARYGPKSAGRYRQPHPVRSTYKIASTIVRAGQIRGLPRRPGTSADRYAAISCHCLQVRSLG
jgi:transposase